MQPVPGEELGLIIVDEQVVHVPRGGEDCPVLDPENASTARYVSRGLEYQLSLWENVLPGQLGGDRTKREITLSEVQRRAEGCKDGTCAFIGQTATCWRRPENASTDS